MNYRLTLILLCVLFLFSCKKDEQSCSDGIFDPDKEEKTDCGGVCPPCDFEPTVIDSFLRADINGRAISFSNYNLTKNPDWILHFQNDSLDIKVNFGSGDSLGGRPIESMYTTAQVNSLTYPDFQSGVVVFAEVDHTENKLSGFFMAKFFSNTVPKDTLDIQGAEFENISW